MSFLWNSCLYSSFRCPQDKGFGGGDDLLCEAKIPVTDMDVSKPCTDTRILTPEFKKEGGKFGKDTKLGHICVALGYAPNTSVLAIFILSCKVKW